MDECFVIDARVYGEVIHLGAHEALVRYFTDGFDFEEWLPLEEIILINDDNINERF